jgi:hypothetical protein
MRRRSLGAVAASVLATPMTSGAAADASLAANCQPDAVEAGTACLDRYEASIWRVPDPTARNAGLVGCQLFRASPTSRQRTSVEQVLLA